MTYRCDACGNRTRFDVTERKLVRGFHHFTLGGDLTVESEEILDRSVESVICRWCGSADVKEDAGALASEGDDA